MWVGDIIIIIDVGWLGGWLVGWVLGGWVGGVVGCGLAEARISNFRIFEFLSFEF